MSSADTTSTIDEFVFLDGDRILDALADAGDDHLSDFLAGLILLLRERDAARCEEYGATRGRADLDDALAPARILASTLLWKCSLCPS